MTPKAPNACVRCGEPSAATFTHPVHGELPVCLAHAEELAGGPIDHVCIPADKEKRSALYAEAGLTVEEREAVDLWVFQQAEQDRKQRARGVRSDTPLSGRTTDG